jgi:DNA repair protein RadC
MSKVNQIEQLRTNPEPRKRVSIIKAVIIKERTILYGARQINTPALAAGLATQLFTNSDREMLVVASLDAKCNPLSLEIAAIGNVNTCIVSSREIFKNAILSNAVHIMVFHNHLSGDCTPSSEDIAITKRLVECGELIGIPLLDHIIIGDNTDYLSMRENDIVSFRIGSQEYQKGA